MKTFDDYNAERVAAITDVFGPPKTEAQLRYLENACADLMGTSRIYVVAAKIYGTIYGSERFPDIDLLIHLADFYATLCDDGAREFEDSARKESNEDLLIRMSCHCAKLATIKHAEALARGNAATEKMRQFGRALLGSAASLTQRR